MLHGLYQVNEVHIIDILGRGMISKFLMVSGKAEDVVDAQGCGAENIALNSNPVPVAGYHLQSRIDTHLFEENTGGKA